MGLRIELLALILPFDCPFCCLLRLNLCQFSPELCKIESSNMIYICRMGIETQGHGCYFSILIHFFSFPILHVNIKNVYIGVFSGTFKARMLKLGIHMDNELLYCGIENQTHCSNPSLYLFIFLSFKAKFVSQFSQELCKLESSNMVYICRMSDCIVGLRLMRIGLLALILPFICPLFCLLFLNMCHSFLRDCAS